MRGYGRDEYEDMDEYEEDGEEEEEEEEEGEEDGYEEPRQPTQDELEYLGLRERLKESIRKQMKKESANSGSRDKVNSYRKDNYGSFFGPSQPVIAQRVIQESKSLLENPDLAARISKANHARSNSSVSSSGKPKVQTNNLPKITNPSKKKVEMIKNTRDYTFLLSEDAEVPASTKSLPSRNISTPKTDARSAGQPLLRSKQVVNDRDRREVVNGVDRRRQMVTSNSQSRPKAGMEKEGSASKLSIESKKQFGSNSGSGPGRPLGAPKAGVPSKSPVPATGRGKPPPAKNSMVGAKKSNHLSVQTAVRKPNPLHLQPGAHRPTSSQSQLLKNASLQRKEHPETSRPKVMSKQELPPSRDQLKRPTLKPAPRGSSANERPKLKPKRQHYDDDDDPDGDNAISMIRQMFGYNPNKFRDDDDDSDMEANFDDILREEKRSALIARKEDEEQLRLIEEEERRERMRLAKKRKMSH